MKIKRIATLALGALLSIQLIAAPLAFADEQVKPVENPDGTLTLTQPFSSTEEAPTLPKELSHEGNEYVLDDTIIAPDETAEKQTQSFSHTLFSEVPLEGINNLGAYFPASVVINEGEYQGEIGLSAANPFTVEERYEAFRRQVDRTATQANLPDNDVSRITQYLNFEVSSAAAPGATTQATLQLLDVQYEVVGTDHLGLPNNYTAYLTYRGQEEYLVLHHYDVTAHYEGVITSNTEQLTATGLYTAEPAAPAPVTTITEVETPLAEPEFPLVPFAITSSAVVIFLATPLFLFFLLSNAKLIRVEEFENSEDKQNNKRRKKRSQLVCRRKLALIGGMAEFRIPDTVDIFDGATYSLIIKSGFASQEGAVTMVWQGKVVSVLPLEDRFDINFREMAVASVETVLLESDLLD